MDKYDGVYYIEEETLTFGNYKVRRINMSDLEVLYNDVIVFKGDDFEVVDYLVDVGA